MTVRTHTVPTRFVRRSPRLPADTASAPEPGLPRIVFQLRSLTWHRCIALAVTSWLALTPAPPLAASSLGQTGDESFPWIVASITEVPTAAVANHEPAPMYRLPAVEAAESFAATEPAREAAPLSEPTNAEAINAELTNAVPTNAVPTNAEPTNAEPTPEMLAEMQHAWVEVMPPNAATAAPPPVATFSPAPSLRPLAPPSYAPTLEGLSKQLLPSVQRAYSLAKNGAAFAAQTEFIQVLRRIAQAKDAAAGTDLHSRSLAAGLRALDEADDFMPQGAELEAEVNVMVIASAHRTPVLAEVDPASPPRPDEAVALYHYFARQELARAVAGEQAGSMALYGLGKVQNRLAQEAQGELRHERQALTLFQAALAAGPSNHLAANEIGVLLSRGGRHVDAAMLFRRAIDVAPSSTSYHNLAVVERKLGYHEYAAANDQYAQHLAAQDRAAGANSRARNVHWVDPQDLTRVTSAEPNMPPQPMTPQMQPPAKPTAAAGTGPFSTAAKWPQKLVPGVFRR